MSDLVGNPEDRFSHNEAQIVPLICLLVYFIAFSMLYNNASSILVLSGQYHIIFNASIVNNCIIFHGRVIVVIFCFHI